MSIGEAMNTSIILRILVGTVLVLSGCVDQGSSEIFDDTLVIHVTDISQINEALANEPVLLKIGGQCQPCRDQNPIIVELAEEYEGKATVMHINVDENPEFINVFDVCAIPDSCVLVGVENGQYVYMVCDGTTSTRCECARFTGLTDKQMLAKTLDYAIEEYNNK